MNCIQINNLSKKGYLNDLSHKEAVQTSGGSAGLLIGGAIGTYLAFRYGVGTAR